MAPYVRLPKRFDPRYISVYTVQYYTQLLIYKIFSIAPSLPPYGRKSVYGPECKIIFKLLPHKNLTARL